MNRCTRCVMPDTRPDTAFEGGLCSACRAFELRPTINWPARETELLDLLSAHGWKCIVPSSGGKDSTYQVMKLLELGAKPTVVTATTCHLTAMGRKNIDNLARHAPTIEVTQNREVRAKLNRMGLELVGDISWPEHMAIFTTPFRIAKALGIKLLFYGENPQAEYGGPDRDSQLVKQMTDRWVSEFGGFLGLRAADAEAIEGHDMSGYELPTDISDIEAHFLGSYLPWSSHHNAMVAINAGMTWHQDGPTPANWWPWENLDNAQTGLHDHMMFLKYGYGRGCAQISVDIRNGKITRNEALNWVMKNDGLFPYTYAGVGWHDVLKRIDVAPAHLQVILDRYTNSEIFPHGARKQA